jgi:hypothetical protein
VVEEEEEEDLYGEGPNPLPRRSGRARTQTTTG